MKRTSTDLYPMRVNPFNFSKGDVVKKVITDNIQTPYTGLVSAIIPSTNKVIVQWPNGEGYEDPWDLIKVNPIINPPVVNQDKAYPSFQNELSHRYYEKIKPNRVLEDFLMEQINPIIMHVSNLYNKGYSKSAAFNYVQKEFDNKALVEDCVNRVYAGDVSVEFVKEVVIDGDRKRYALKLAGDSNTGFNLSVTVDKDKKNYLFNSLIHASEQFNTFKKMINSYKTESDYPDIVKKVLSDLKKKSA